MKASRFCGFRVGRVLASLQGHITGLGWQVVSAVELVMETKNKHGLTLQPKVPVEKHPSDKAAFRVIY